MNRGHIPGFYYDEEKKKYFRIVADHNLPAGVRHSNTNAKIERKQAKKRKLEQLAEHRLRNETISRPRILSLPQFGGIGLHRELGCFHRTTCQARADAAYASQLHLQKAHLNSESDTEARILSTFPIPSLNRTLITTFWPRMGGKSTTSLYPRDFSRLEDRVWQSERLEWHMVSGLMAYNAPVVSTSVWPPKDPELMLQCANTSSSSAFVARIGDNETASTVFDAPCGFGNERGALWDTAISPNGSRLAIACGHQIEVHDMRPRSLTIIDSHNVLEPTGPCVLNTASCRAVDWLSPHILVAGDRKNILLWDLRTPRQVLRRGGGTIRRFVNDRPITGLHVVPNSSMNQILVSSTRSLNLFDLRMPSTRKDRALLSIPNMSEVPTLNFDISSRGIVATSTKQGASTELRLISLTSGKELRTLKMPISSPIQPSQIAWFPDEQGIDYLSVCAGSWIYKWTWADLDKTGD